MDIRTMRYYLAVVKEGTISAAAEALHIAQPSLSRQMKELEEELGASLFLRGSRHITLTEEGLILQRRAEELVQLWQKTEGEIENSGADISGDIYIGAAETEAVHFLTRAAGRLHDAHPDVHFHIASGDTTDTLYQLEQGLIDFALLFYLSADEKYHTLSFPVCDKWGVLLPQDHPLAKRKQLSFARDLIDQPLILSRMVKDRTVAGIPPERLNIVATYNLAYNASLMVEDGLGIAICFDSIVNVHSQAKSSLRFVPIRDLDIEVRPTLIWKKDQVLSRASREFLRYLERVLAD